MKLVRHNYPMTHPLGWAGLPSQTAGITCRLAIIQRRWERHWRRHKPLWQMVAIRKMKSRRDHGR